MKTVDSLENGHVTDVAPSRADVYADFDMMRSEAKIKSFGGKWVKRNYAFGTKDIPERECDWLKIIYGFNGERDQRPVTAFIVLIFWDDLEKALPTGLSSPNIAHILGAQTSPFEIFVLKRKIMGPCWLRIQSPEVKHNGVCRAIVFAVSPVFWTTDQPFSCSEFVVQNGGDG
jgi:DNA polymerase alpha subunit A